jgi:hypothetical protein
MADTTNLTASEPSSLAQYEPASATGLVDLSQLSRIIQNGDLPFLDRRRLVKDVIRRARELHLRRLELGVEAEKTGLRYALDSRLREMEIAHQEAVLLQQSHFIDVIDRVAVEQMLREERTLSAYLEQARALIEKAKANERLHDCEKEMMVQFLEQKRDGFYNVLLRFSQNLLDALEKAKRIEG